MSESVERSVRMKFEDLPITFDAEELNSEGWRRRVERHGTVKELLEIWDIDNDDCAMAQVLRHLRWAMENLRPESLAEHAERHGLDMSKYSRHDPLEGPVGV